MTEFQSWRRKIQSSKPLPVTHGYIQENGEAGQSRSKTPIQTQEGPAHRPRPKSRLASYLSSHKASNSVDRQTDTTLNASTLATANGVLSKDKDDVYDLDIESTASAIRTQLLVYPSKDLPAKYNASLLQVLESYYQMCVNVKALQTQNAATEREYQAEVNKVRVLQDEWTKERESHQLQLANIQSGSFEREGDMPKQSQKNAKADWLDTRMNRAWPDSPSRSMSHLSRRLLSARDDREVLHHNSDADPESLTSSSYLNRRWRTASIPGPTLSNTARRTTESSESDLSSMEGDLLPDEEDLLKPNYNESLNPTKFNHLVARLINNQDRINRNNSSTGVKLQSVSHIARPTSESFSKYSEENYLRQIPSPRCLACPKPGWNPDMLHSHDGDILKWNEDHKGSNRRAFSFMPGDDARAAISSTLILNNTQSPITRSRASTPVENVAKTREGAVNNKPSLAIHLPHGEEFETTAFNNEKLALRLRDENAAFTPQRENSARSVMTAIKTSPSHGSRSSRSTSAASDARVLTKPKHPVAMAAARAAGSRPRTPN